MRRFILVVLIALLALSLPQPGLAQSSYASLIISDGPERYYRLGEASGTTAADEMGNGDGTYNGSPTLGVTGALSGDSDTAVTFDGTDDTVTIPTLSLASTSFSLEMWIKPEIHGVYGYHYLWSATTDSNNWVKLYITDDGLLGWYSHVAGIDTSVSKSAIITTSGWQHVAAIFDSGALTLYWNGVQQATGSVDTFTGSSPTIKLGTFDIDPEHYKGSMDEYAIYTRALTPTEVEEHYQVGSGTTPPTPTPTPATTVTPSPAPSFKQYLIQLSSGNFAAVDLSFTLGDIAVVTVGVMIFMVMLVTFIRQRK